MQMDKTFSPASLLGTRQPISYLQRLLSLLPMVHLVLARTNNHHKT